MNPTLNPAATAGARLHACETLRAAVPPAAPRRHRRNRRGDTVIFPAAAANKLAGAGPAPPRAHEIMPPTPSDDAFLAALQQHKAILYKVANAYCSRREDRGDLIQDIVVALWQAWPRYDRDAAFAGWMQRIAINVAISFYRGESRRIRDALPIEEFGMDLAAADRVLAAEEDDLRALHQLIAQLDEINRALILLYLEGYAQDEIAALVGISATNVATRINRIKQKLQRAYAAAEDTV